MNAQNYKNYFTPSFNISAAVVVNGKKAKYDIGLAWEPHFIFAKNSLGNLKTYRNDFLTLSAGFDPKKIKEPIGRFGLRSPERERRTASEIA